MTPTRNLSLLESSSSIKFINEVNTSLQKSKGNKANKDVLENHISLEPEEEDNIWVESNLEQEVENISPTETETDNFAEHQDAEQKIATSLELKQVTPKPDVKLASVRFRLEDIIEASNTPPSMNRKRRSVRFSLFPGATPGKGGNRGSKLGKRSSRFSIVPSNRESRVFKAETLSAFSPSFKRHRNFERATQIIKKRCDIVTSLIDSAECDEENETSIFSEEILIEDLKENSAFENVHLTGRETCNDLKFVKKLDEGSFKQVYQVQKRSEMYALSEIKFFNVIHYTLPMVYANEMAASLKVTEVSQKYDCDFLLKTLDIFETTFDIFDVDHDDEADSPQQLINYSELRCYILMELCELSNIESYFKKQKRFADTVFVPDLTKVLFFQMIYGLHVLQEELAFHHYDIKLLNYFLTCKEHVSRTYPVPVGGKGSEIERYSFDQVFESCSKCFVVKLADFGTSDFDDNCKYDASLATEGEKLVQKHRELTTYENTPIDYLIQPLDKKKQSTEFGDVNAKFDSFQLGLCFLHLHTGKAPYEEIMHKVKANNYFCTKIRKFWFESRTKRI